MTWRLRQVTSIVGDLEAALRALDSELGLSVSRRGDGESEQQQGVATAFLPIGDTFLEVVSPSSHDAPPGRFHKRYGDGGFMVILQCDDLESARRRLAEQAVRIAWEIEEPDATELHLDHRDVAGSLLAIDRVEPRSSWRWAGPDWPSHVQTGVVSEIVGATILGSDPQPLAARWGAILDQPVRAAGSEFEIALDRGCLRFGRSDQDGPGRLMGIDVAAGPAGRVGSRLTIAGLELCFVAGEGLA